MNGRSFWVGLGIAGAIALGGCSGDDGADPGDAGIRPDSARGDAGPTDAGMSGDMDAALGVDAGPLDRDSAVTLSDAGVDGGEADAAICPPPARTDYTCTSDPASCPGGVCITSLCLGPDSDPTRWAACGDGTCSACESATSCPADCATPTVRTGTIAFDPATTITIKVHGLAVSTGGSLDDRTYAGVVAPGELEATIRRFATLPDGTVDETAPNQLVAGEFYGTHPASWLTPAEVAEIEAFDAHSEEALARYGLALAKFIRHRLELAGATHAAIVCHSMGCHVTRYIIEHDLESLTSTRRISRIVTVAGAVAGAGLARLFDNPLVRDYAVVSPIQTSDFTHLDPDYVADNSAVWDHRLHEANNPNWSGILMHMLTGSDPSAGILRPLDIINPENEPNDAILFARDTFFVAQADAVRFVTPSGERFIPTHSWNYSNHPSIEANLGAGALVAAGLYHRRKVIVRLRYVTLLDDHERDGPFDIGTYGEAPADIVPETIVRYDPYLPDTFGVTGAIVHEQRRGDRSAPLFTMMEGDTTDVNQVLFEGPVFDGMTSLDLELSVREVDNYPRFGVTELPSGDGSELVAFRGPVAIADGTFDIISADMRVTVDVHVVDMY